MTIATSYPKMGTVGVPLRVPLRLTQGRATRIEVWLGAEPKAMTIASQGIEFGAMDAFVVPQTRGVLRLYAAAEDSCGNRNQTGVVRTVTVQ